MRSVRLGRTDMMVSEVGFGGIPIIPLDFEAGARVVKHAFDSGITFFDTANMYGDSEKKIGRALKDCRDQAVIATKTLDRTTDGTKDHITLSLNNLKTDRLDLYQLHNISKESELKQVLGPGGAMQAVSEAMRAGRIGHVGFSSHDIPTAMAACRTGLFETIQFPFNFIERQPSDALFKIASELDMGVIAMKPLGGGLLERADICFKFLQQYPEVVPIPGFQSEQELDEVIALYEQPQPLTDENRAAIESLRAELGTRFCHRCGYCLPCEQEVRIPEIMGFRSMSRRLSQDNAVLFAKGAMDSVENCTECGECLEKCPYSLPIPELIREHLRYYNGVSGEGA